MRYRDELELIIMIGILVVGTIALVVLGRAAWI